MTVEADECEEAGGWRAMAGSAGGGEGEATASSSESGFAIRNPPRDWDRERSLLMVRSAYVGGMPRGGAGGVVEAVVVDLTKRATCRHGLITLAVTSAPPPMEIASLPVREWLQCTPVLQRSPARISRIFFTSFQTVRVMESFYPFPPVSGFSWGGAP